MEENRGKGGEDMPIYTGHRVIVTLCKETARRRGMTGAKVGQALHMMPADYSRALNNSRMTIERLSEIAAALGCDLIVDFRPHDGPEE